MKATPCSLMLHADGQSPGDGNMLKGQGIGPIPLSPGPLPVSAFCLPRSLMNTLL